MALDGYESALRATQIQVAEQGAATPQNRDAFEYGRVHGYYAGLQKALDLYLDHVRDQNAKDDRL